MPNSQFWCLQWPESSRRLASWAAGEVQTEKIVCPINDGHQRQGKRLSDLSVTLPRYPVQDFVWEWGGGCLLRDSAIELLKDNRFTGFEVKPVKVRFKRGSGEPPRLWELVVTGWGGMAPPGSGIRLIESCLACGSPHYLGARTRTC